MHMTTGLQSYPTCTTRALRRTQAAGRLSRRCLSNGRSRAAAKAVGSSTMVLEEQLALESFYDILGVPSTADKRTIKAAYISIMKECHPDKSNEDANEFCALLNEIYETLSDPARRAAYDMMSGFSIDSINPFLDTTYERDQVFVDEFTCIGCRNCCNVCPSSFAIEDEYGRARVIRQGQDTPEKLQEAIDTCPVSCIHWVSSPQLSLLETAMARMERIAVWSMGMSSAASNKDVFTEASLAWQKRRSELMRQRSAMMSPAPVNTPGQQQQQQQQKKQAPWSKWWNNSVSFEGASGSSFFEQAQAARERASQHRSWSDSNAYSSSDEDSWGPQEPLTDKEARKIAALAARAARAARTWRTFQQRMSKRSSLQLASVSSVGSVDL